MNARITTMLAVSAVALGFSSGVFASDKARYDIPASFAEGGTGMSRIASSTVPGWKLEGTAGELAVSPGGYFTMGTTRGLSATTLDDNCGITFGHPYARTSYPVICVDGTWGKALRFFSPDSEVVETGGDSLVLSYRTAGVAVLRLVYLISPDGTTYSIHSTLTNLDIVPHTFASGFVIDPALGIRGDGSLHVDGVPIVRDTMLLSVGNSLMMIKERNTSPTGLKVALGFPDTSPVKLIAANWEDREDVDAPVYVPSTVRLLYDLDLHLSWEPQQVPPGGSLSESFAVTMLTPDFGAGVFLRWDLPDHIQMDDGIAFPVTFRSTVTATNLTGLYKTGTVTVMQDADIVLDPATKVITPGPLGTAYATHGITVSEAYENEVVTLLAAYDDGSAKDSIYRRLFVPATPVSDTGLVVVIDSIATGHFPDVTAFIEVKRQATGQYIYSLAQKNIALYDNATRISDVAIQRDTAGGATQRDIVFVLDVTGSMSGAIDGVKNNIIEFADSLEAQGVLYRLGMVTFLDIVENVYDFTSDAALFKTYVSAQYAHGGDDAPENSLDALYRASEMPFSQTGSHIVIWITDNSYHEADAYTSRVRADVIARLLETNITVYAIGEPAFQTDWYDPIVDATGGKYYDYRGNFRDILIDIGGINASRKLMVSYAAPQSGSSSHTIVLNVHYGGRGGTASATYQAPGGTVAVGGISCYPNPFNPVTTIRLDVPAGAMARVVLCDYLGREVRRLELPPGSGVREITWDARDERGRDIATGVYFARATVFSTGGAPLGNAVTKILYLK